MFLASSGGAFFAPVDVRPLPLSMGNGGPNFKVFYRHDTEPRWHFKYHTTVDEATASRAGAALWTVLSKESGLPLFAWREISFGNLRGGLLIVQRRDYLKQMLPNQENLRIVFAKKSGDSISPLFQLDLEPLCREYGNLNFQDLGSSGSEERPCHSRIPEGWVEKCDGIHAGLRVNIQTIPSFLCSNAREKYRGHGCGEFVDEELCSD